MSEAALQRARDRAARAGRDRAARTNNEEAAANPNSTQSRLEAERAAYRERKAAQSAKAAGMDDPSQTQEMDAEDKVIMKGRVLQQENKDALANSIRVAQEATQVGAQTIQKLAEQKEQMLRIDDNLDATNASLDRSNRVIRGMKSLGGSIANFFSKPKAHESQRLDILDAEEQGRRNAAAAREAAMGPNANNESRGGKKQSEISFDEQQRIDRSIGNKMATGKYKSYNDPTASTSTGSTSTGFQSEKGKNAIREFEDNQKEEDSQLDQLGDLMDTLKVQATDMNTQLHTHAVIIDHLDKRVTDTAPRIQSATREMKKIT